MCDYSTGLKLHIQISRI